MADMKAIAEALKSGKARDVKAMVSAALEEGVSASTILNEGLVVGMGEVGELFKANEIYVPEVLIAARAMKAGMELIKPLLAASDVQPAGVAAIGTVKGDLHDIGKNLVGMMLEGAGFQVIDLGIDVGADKFIEAIKGGAKLIGMSTLLTTTMPEMKNVIEAIKEAGLRDQVKIIIGGAPVTQSFADEIGADGYSADAASAVDLAKALLQ
nr:corrinoid protein [bacterium]